MSTRGWMMLGLAIAVAGWWFSPHSARVPKAAATASGSHASCPMPPRVAGDIPLQSTIPATMGPFELAAAQLQPLAGFSIDARVLSRADYRIDREASLSPTDLALGWGHMRDDAVLSHLRVGQSSRWYQYQWSADPPLPVAEIAHSSANMHMIPSSALVAAQLHHVHQGDHIRIDGWLVEADAPDGWRWRSSLTREDVGSGACELIYVCAITQL